jgi:hypothetical protein
MLRYTHHIQLREHTIMQRHIEQILGDDHARSRTRMEVSIKISSGKSTLIAIDIQHSAAVFK